MGWFNKYVVLKILNLDSVVIRRREEWFLLH